MTQTDRMTQTEFGKLLGFGWVLRTVKTEGEELIATMWNDTGGDEKIAIEKLGKPEPVTALPDADASPDEAEAAAAQAKSETVKEAEKATKS